ncbi:shikimate kinase [Desulfovibrio sp.]
MSTPEHLLPPPPACPCVVLIGMAGAGKSTVGMALAQTLGWAFMDSDYLMEALYADRLQSVTDALSKEAFLDLEAVVLG